MVSVSLIDIDTSKYFFEVMCRLMLIGTNPIDDTRGHPLITAMPSVKDRRQDEQNQTLTGHPVSILPAMQYRNNGIRELT